MLSMLFPSLKQKHLIISHSINIYTFPTAGGGGQDTRALQHRDNGRHIPPRQDGGDARRGQAVRSDERGLRLVKELKGAEPEPCPLY